MIQGSALTTQAQGVSVPFLETFDTTTSTTWNNLNLNLLAPTTIVHVQDISAYGVDSGSVMINLWAAGPQTIWEIESPVINNAANNGLTLTFDLAAAVRHVGPLMIPQDYAEDYLMIKASSNGGAVYSLVDSMRIGLDGPLNTGGRRTNVFSPVDSEWVSAPEVLLPKGTNRVKFEI